MKQLKLYLYIFILLISLNYVNALLTDNIRFSFSFENNTDNVGNILLNTNSSVVYNTSCIKGGCFNYNGSSWFRSNDNSNLDFGTGNFTLIVWHKSTGTTASLRYLGTGSDTDGAGNRYTFGRFTTGSSMDFYNGGAEWYVTPLTPSHEGVWLSSVYVRSGITGANTIKFYWNGTEKYSGDMGNNTINAGVTGLVIGARPGANNATLIEKWIGQLDEITMWNRALNASELAIITNVSHPQAFYPFDYVPGVTPTYNISINNTPNINTSTLFTNITATVNSTLTNLTNDSMTLYTTIKTTLNNNCSIFYQTQCIDNGTYKPYTMNKINNKTFYKYLTDTEIFPAYYPYNYTVIDNSVHFNETVYSNNNIMFNITNFSTQVSKFNILLEMGLANKTGVNSALLIYYCNSSYTSGNPSLRPESCELVDSYMSDTYIHTHNNSRHTTIPIVIKNITKTQNSYIIFVGQSNALNGWTFDYVLNSAYNNASFRFGAFNAFNVGSTKTNMIFDIHIHPFNDNDIFHIIVF
jgi:hypothetical protein